MYNLIIEPQKFSFTKPAIVDGYGKVLTSAIDLTIEADTFTLDKEQLKKELSALFNEVLEYFG